MTMSKIKQFEIVDANLVGDDSVSAYIVEEISLEKKMLCPNELRFTLRRNKVERTQNTIQFSVASYLLSKTVKCTIETSLKGLNQTNTGYYSVQFEGTIVSAAMENLNINCVALSNDFLLSLIPHCNCFVNKTLQEIVDSVVSNTVNKTINPSYTAKIPYVVQYNETDYEFLVRLAKRYGEFFYFDQKHGLVFGNLPADAAVNLNHIDDFFTVQYELASGNPNHSYVANHYQKEGILRSELKDYGSGKANVANLFVHSKTASTEVENDLNNIPLYYDYPNLLPSEESKTSLNDAGGLWSKSESSNFVICRCATYRPDLYVGLLVRFCEAAGGVNYDNSLFAITSVRLTLDCNGSPVNEITAIGGVVYDNNISFIPPYVDVNAYPKSSAQRAIVVDNVDPQKMGRVRVCFAWQNVIKNSARNASKDDYKDFPWIRIAQPYSGREKGCYILPEIGEEVMVGFEHDNLEKPFVIGTLFNNTKPEGQEQMPDETWCEVAGDQKANEENEVKAFRTKKGHTIEFHDTKDGDGFIRIYGNEKKDQPNYDIILSTDKIQKQNGDQKEDYQTKCVDESAEAGKDIKEKEDYKLEKLRIMVRSNGGDIMLDAGDGDIIMNAKNIRTHTTGNVTSLIEGMNILKVNGAQYVDVKSASLMVQENQTIKVKGDDKEEYAKEVSLSAKSIKTDTSGDTELKASGQLVVNATKEVKMNSQTGLQLESSSKATLKGASVSVEAQANAALKGVQVNVEADGINTVKGTSIVIDATTGTRKGTWTDM